MNAQTENKNQTKESSNIDNKELISQLEKQVSIAIWIQTIGKIMEVLLLTKILLIDEEARSDPNERQVVEGVWIETIGQILEGIGVTKDVLANEEPIKLEATNIANIGDWLQGIGAIYAAHAEKLIIAKDREELVTNLFVP
ncbi:hypothetical protein ACIQAA_27950 [Neobacillus sp. NPDC093182]|uniref:hypothetical protein n=1 Tax=Neobacillus sp. NPDC093182 TaxID=3364297 RepID=UPI0037F38DA5